MSCCCCLFDFFEPEDPVLAISSLFVSQSVLACYKFLLSIYFVFWCFFWPIEENIDDGFKFVTYWTFYVGAFYFLASCITAYKFAGRLTSPTASDGPVRGTVGMRDGDQPLSSSARSLIAFQIFMWNVACVGSLVVVVVFWGVLYDGGPVSTTDVNAHVMIAVIMIIDNLLMATKWERRQMWASVLYSVAYIAFNVAYFYLESDKEERVIYNILDWGEDASKAALVAGGIIVILVPIFGLLHYGVFSLRECLYESCTKRRHSPQTDIERGRVGKVAAVNHR